MNGGGTENAVRTRDEILQALKDLLAWEAMMGGWEAPCWARARKVAWPDLEEEEDDDEAGTMM